MHGALSDLSDNLTRIAELVGFEYVTGLAIGFAREIYFANQIL